MRYRKKRGISDTLKWLAERGVVVHRDTYQSFLRRVLWVLPDERAKELAIDLALLRAVRCRLQIPITPSAKRPVAAKITRPFHSRGRQRHVGGEEKAKPVQGPPVRPASADRLHPNRLLLNGAVGTLPLVKPVAGMRGTPEDPRGHADWKILHELARDKMLEKDRRVMVWEGGTVIHLHTRQEYTEEDLVAEFGLTPNEAKAFSMRF